MEVKKRKPFHWIPLESGGFHLKHVDNMTPDERAFVEESADCTDPTNPDLRAKAQAASLKLFTSKKEANNAVP